MDDHDQPMGEYPPLPPMSMNARLTASFAKITRALAGAVYRPQREAK